jgi:predicted NodU family carbamoyl transferase
VLDGRAERQTSLLAAARGTGIERLSEVSYRHSFGLFCGTVTQFLGFGPDRDEWKVMALGSDGDPAPFLEALRPLVRAREDGSFALALEYFEFYNQVRSADVLGPAGRDVRPAAASREGAHRPRSRSRGGLPDRLRGKGRRIRGGRTGRRR